MKKTHLILFTGVCIIAMMLSCKHEIPVLPGPPGEEDICFETQVLPIFQSYCAKSGCHDAGTASEGYILDSYNNIVARGIDEGNAAGSKIYEVLIEAGEDRMPQAPNDPLSAEQISIIAQWINEGAQNTTGCAPVCDSSSFTYSGDVKPILQTHCLGCHGGNAASGGFIPLGTYDDINAIISADILLPAIQHTGSYPMPKNGAKLNDCKIAIISKWIAAGAPNN